MNILTLFYLVKSKPCYHDSQINRNLLNISFGCMKRKDLLKARIISNVQTTGLFYLLIYDTMKGVCILHLTLILNI